MPKAPSSGGQLGSPTASVSLGSLARVLDHVPEPSQQTVRYWGYYANAARGKRRKAEQGEDPTQTSLNQDDDEFTPRASLSWAKLIRRVYEVDPLLARSAAPR